MKNIMRSDVAITFVFSGRLLEYEEGLNIPLCLLNVFSKCVVTVKINMDMENMQKTD